MRNDIPTILDTVNKQLVELNTKIDRIDDKIILDNWFKIIAIAVPIIVGILVFFLTRKKEILFKKAEVAGEIFMRLHELKKLRFEYKTEYLDKCAYEACLRLPEHVEVDMHYIKHVFQIDEVDKPKQTKEKIDNLAKELMKYLGQYKFYISKRDKTKLNQKSIVITLNHQKHELFENCNSVKEIVKQHEKIMISKLFDNWYEIEIDGIFTEIENLISK